MKLSKTEFVIILAIIGLVGILFLINHHKETVTMPEAYKAWVKLTGNTNDLSYKEWRNLIRSTENNDQPPIIIFNN